MLKIDIYSMVDWVTSNVKEVVRKEMGQLHKGMPIWIKRFSFEMRSNLGWEPSP